MQGVDFGTAELRYLWLSIALGLVQLVLYVIFNVASGRSNWAIGARDAEGPPFNKFGGRADRAWKNFAETFAMFAALVLMAQALNKHNAQTLWGAEFYFWGRVAYVPLYLFGIPVARTLAWMVAIAGVVLLLAGILQH